MLRLLTLMAMAPLGGCALLPGGAPTSVDTDWPRPYLFRGVAADPMTAAAARAPYLFSQRAPYRFRRGQVVDTPVSAAPDFAYRF